MARYLDDGDGGLVNQPAKQVAFVAQVASTAATNSSPYGFSQTQANNLVAAVNSILTALIAAGIMKSS